ncbi:kinase/pyrophosphorylase [Evansella sp. LMS18]|uniref:pyruvate, water dikinase regulatory protein n=1 Tax=Evansella sp. LMS18 TaxID=2924033 RepID=UPI0020D104B5|nr:pyruvate, water dikinase regulatory protein [Evansella sp. LMS18]UTR10615.1 kinase/pyrophosphorylase [Evansella sp. LMS18]
MERKETVFVVSDSVGETAQFVVQAAVSQFSGGAMDIRRHSYVEEAEDIEDVIQEAKYMNSIIAYTLVIPELKNYLDRRAKEEDITSVDLMSPLLNALSDKFQKKPKNEPGMVRKLDDAYFRKIEAIEFAVKYDDGRDPRGIKKADIVLIGVSRTSKTPLSMYLAHHRFKVANVPLVPEVAPPEELYEVPRKKCVGLIISPDKLNEIRKERLKALGLTAESSYARLDRILEELEHADKIMKRVGCPVIDVSNKAVEETANLILENFKMERSSV